MTMRAMVLTESRQIQPRSLPLPEIGPREVLVRVMATGVCGSDLATWRGTHPYKRAPATLGHELSGVVVRCGVDVSSMRRGDRICASSYGWCGQCVPCTKGRPQLCAARVNLSHRGLAGSFAEYLVLREEMAFQLPSGVDFSRGALVEPLSIGVHAVRLAGPRLGARLLILGCGTIGLSCCLVARSLGFARIVCTDADAAKGKLAAGAGADVFLDAGGRVVEEALLALGGDADVTIVASGHSRALQEATEVTRPGGEVIVVSFFGGPAPVPLDDVVRREISVRGACLSTPVDFTDALDWIAKGTIDPLTLVTHHFALEEAARALQLMDAGQPGVGKILLYPGEGVPGAR
jgi:2-desacetyl-2-hydroxyethyl bacteriochlorophyllide A dehydrogenase